MQPASTSDLAEWLGVSAEIIRDLEKRGVLAKLSHGKWDLRASILAYTAHLREVAAGRSSEASDDEGFDLVSERARLAKEQADSHAMKNAVMRGDLLPKSDVVAGWQTAIAHSRAKLLAIPSKVAPLVLGLGSIAEIRDKLKVLIDESLAELARARFVAVRQDSDDQSAGGGGADGSGGDLGPASESDDQRVGGSEPGSKRRGKRRTG